MPQDHAALDAAMQSRKFRDTITCDLGIVYLLPPGEYLLRAAHTSAEQCRDLAEQAALECDMPFAIFVTEGVSRAWQGLSPAAPLAPAE